jgi:hypothetical protein
VVGVAGPLITWRATRDSQITATRAEFVRGDRAEIRQILDRAALDLNELNHEIGGGISDWANSDRPLPVARFRSEITAVDKDVQRLQIRLGTTADASREMSAARAAQLDAVAMLVIRPATERDRAVVEKHSDEADERYRRFVSAANRLARSTLE